MTDWIDVIVQGMLLGGLYALYASGLSLIFGVMRLVNVAHGDLIVLAAFLAFAIRIPGAETSFASLLLTVPVMFAIGYVLQRALLNGAMGANVLRPMLLTFGLSIVLQNGLLEVFSADARKLPGGAIETMSLPLGNGIAVGILPVITLLAAIAVLGALQFMLRRTAIGRAFRATSDDAEAAGWMGINHRNLFALATGMSMAVVGIAAVFMGTRASFDPASGPDRLIFAFEAVVIGGLGSLWGTLAGGIALGVAQSVGASLDPDWQLLAGHLLFLLVLLIAPNGIFPQRGNQ
ncbi:branched-chain amino acid ABC transporter permease [Cupriavidus basilensis]|uniref:High-affinity branched-chain amino acid transport system permease protein LivH n=1 Tax=Cupriavidus basilensis TaxID=68895 RepID=A0A0C4YML8_9BURK|nr:branched-chain amino acid ABC transporter permease [Cupriavidus basilensis]AJG24268.1 High-affinity branched-chain amino acid transport system permease protein LivH [Cupriavidus basilensis]